MPGPRGVTNDDREIGARLRWARGALGATRREFAEVLGVSVQQVFKYEFGHSRIAAGQLVAISRAFKIPVARLFGDIGADLPVSLFRDFSMLDADLQEAVVNLTRTLASRTGSS